MTPEKYAKEYKRLREKLLPGAACEICLVSPAEVLHHRKGRGVYTLDEEHLMKLCNQCHDVVHDDVQAAYAAGWLLSRHNR